MTKWIFVSTHPIEQVFTLTTDKGAYVNKEEKKYVILHTRSTNERIHSRILHINLESQEGEALYDSWYIIISANAEKRPFCQEWYCKIESNHVFSATETRLLREILDGFRSFTVYEVVIDPDGNFTLGDKVIDPISI